MASNRSNTHPPKNNTKHSNQTQQVVQLILTNQSVLHGRRMHLSVADVAHLAMLREPKGRIVD